MWGRCQDLAFTASLFPQTLWSQLPVSNSCVDWGSLLRHTGNEPAPLGSIGKGPPLLCCIITKNNQWPFIIAEVTVDRQHWSDKERRVQIGMWEERKFRETNRTSIVRQYELNTSTENKEEWHGPFDKPWAPDVEVWTVCTDAAQDSPRARNNSNQDLIERMDRQE